MRGQGAQRRLALVLVAAAALWSAAASLTHPWADGSHGRMRLFGDFERASPDLSRFGQWTRLLARADGERQHGAGCGGADCPLARWSEFLDELRGQPPLAQLRQVHTFVNMVRFVDDRENYGTSDHWAAPGEFFLRGGDCEDFAAAKYFSLRRLGWDMRRVRIVVGTELRFGGDHARRRAQGNHLYPR